MGRIRRTVAGVAATVALAAAPATAHVDYVTDGGGEPVDPVEFVGSVVAEPANAAILGSGALAVALAVGGYLQVRPLARDRAALGRALAEYDAFLPWMLRLAIGLPLVGAGFAGYFFTPAVPAEARLLQVGVGFLLLFGLATRMAAIAGLLLFLVGLAFDPRLVLALEFVGGFAGIALLGGGRPSADHLLQRVADAPGTLYGRFDPVHAAAARVNRRLDPLTDALPLVLRGPVGLTFVLLGVGEKLGDPGRALEVVATYDLTAVVPVDPGLWVVGAGLVELGVGVAILLGAFTRTAAATAFLTLTLTLFGLPDDPVLAHVSLFGLASALFVTGAGPASVDRWLTRRLDSARA